MPPQNDAPDAQPADAQAAEREKVNDDATSGASPEVKALRNEAAKYRTERNDLRKRLESLEGTQRVADQQREAAEQARLKEQGEYKQLYESHAQKLKAAQDRVIDGEIRARLATAGVTDARKQAFLLPALRASVVAEVDESWAVTGNFDSAISEAVEVLGINKPAPTPAPDAAGLNPAALLLTQSLPQPDKGTAGGDVLAQMKAALLR